MTNISQLLAPLPPLHRQALEWFFRRTGQIHRWPGKERFPAGEAFLASAPKGIYKPKWTHYALSVRQSLNGPYADQIVRRPDGTWSYSYYQEGFDLNDFATKATNRGLLACMKDQVPIGVFRQVAKNPSRYEILGLALVATYDGGFFFLEGASVAGQLHEPGPQAEIDFLTNEMGEELTVAHASDVGLAPPLLARKRILTQIMHRRGQQAFREQLLDAYGEQCAATEYNAPEALEAAHIVPYADQGLSTPQNGLLLRADVHTLFDLGLVAVRSDSMKVVVSDRLAGTKYEPLHERVLHLPSKESLRPDPEALERHAKWAGIG